MSDETSVPAESAADAAREARRRRRLAACTALWTLVLALLPTLLQIEPHRGARLETLRVLGPVADVPAAGGPAAARAPGRTAAGGADRPIGLRYGAVREAGPSELELRAGLGPGRVLGAGDNAPILAAAESASLMLPPGDTAGPASFSLPVTPASFGGGGPLIVAPATPTTPSTPTPPVTSNPVTNPVAPPPVTPPPITPPTGPGPPTTPPVTVIIPPPPGPPPTGPDPGTPPPPGTGDPGGVTVTIPTGPDPSSPVTAGGVPEPAVWLELIVGFGLAGAALRHWRRTPVAG